MAFLQISDVQISGLSVTVPKNVESNSELTGFSPEEAEHLKKVTGIHSRRIATENQTASSLCLEAARALLIKQQWIAADIEILVFVSQTPDHTIPGSATLLQHQLGLSASCISLDINQGCSGYVYGLSVISAMMSSGKLKKGLLLVGDTISKTLASNDKSTVPIFSDAGSATTLEYSENADPLFFNLQSNGEKFKAIFKPSNQPLQMSGHEVYYFGLKEVPKNVNELLENAAVEKKDIDYFVFHQANLLLNEGIRRKLNLEKEKVPYSLREYGNSSCATIPLTLAHSLANQLRNKKHKYLLSGFGVGLSWGSAIINISDIVCLDIIEVE